MTGRSKRPERKLALGVRSHSGWAAYVVLGGKAAAPDILRRGKMVLCDASIKGSKQPFHEAEPMAFSTAERFIKQCESSTAALSDKALAQIVREVGAIGACCVLTASGRPLPGLQDILLSHALIHAAEGEFYRDAILAGCRKMGIAVEKVRERDIAAAGDRLPGTEAERRDRLARFGKQVGSPWTQDEKLSALAAWMVLASKPSKHTKSAAGTRASRVLA